MVSRQEPPYQIKIAHEDRFWVEVARLPKSSREDLLAFMSDVLQYRPTTYIPGKCKPLSGEYRGYWEYELARFRRLIYRPSDEERVVYIEYIGAHPDSRKRRRRPRL